MKKLSTKKLKDLSGALILSAALFFTANRVSAQVCANANTTIYSLSNSGAIYPISVSNASVGSVVNATSLGGGGSANAIGYNTLNGLFYYFQNNGSSSQQFVSYDPITNVYTTLAAAPISGAVNKGCVSFNGTGYYCLDNNSNLCYYDIPSNTWTMVSALFTDQYGNNVSATFQSEGSGDMAIDGLGNLWIVTSSTANWGLYEIAAPLGTASIASITVKQLIAPTTATTGGANFVGIAFDPTGNMYMATNYDLYLLHNDLTMSHIGAFNVSGACGDLTSCNFPSTSLAVSWETFSVSLQGNGYADLSWGVAQQYNSKGYYVQRSADGTNWEELGFVPDNGGTQGAADYAFTDNSPYSGTNYYRIRQLGLDGTSNYSVIKALNIENANSLSVWPNPAKDMIRIRNNYGAGSIMAIYSQSGSLVMENRLQPGINAITVSSLSFGAYIISVRSANGQSYNQKFIKE